MKIGDLCRVIVNGHIGPSQLGDLILITKFIGLSYIEGINTRTGNRHHYDKNKVKKLEKILDK